MKKKKKKEEKEKVICAKKGLQDEIPKVTGLSRKVALETISCLFIFFEKAGLHGFFF